MKDEMRPKRTPGIRQKGKKFYFYCNVGGKRVELAGGSTEAEAKAARRKYLAEADTGKRNRFSHLTRLADLCRLHLDEQDMNQRKAAKRARECWVRLAEFFGNEVADRITTARMYEYAVARQQGEEAEPGKKARKPVKPATVNQELAVLRHAFRLAHRAELVARIPYIPMLQVSNVRQGFFEEAEFRAVLDKLPDYLQSVMEAAYYLGWRKSEVLGLHWKDVDFAAGTIRLEPGTTKNSDGRTFFMSALPPLEDLFREQRERTSELERSLGKVIPWVFYYPRGMSGKQPGDPIRSYYHAWKRACCEAGLPGRLVHDFRRTAVRNLERAGVSRSVATKITGHRTEAVYRRYAIVNQEDMAEGTKKLARSLGVDRG